jgi:hypothetical protein
VVWENWFPFFLCLYVFLAIINDTFLPMSVCCPAKVKSVSPTLLVTQQQQSANVRDMHEIVAEEHCLTILLGMGTSKIFNNGYSFFAFSIVFDNKAMTPPRFETSRRDVAHAFFLDIHLTLVVTPCTWKRGFSKKDPHHLGTEQGTLGKCHCFWHCAGQQSHDTKV